MKKFSIYSLVIVLMLSLTVAYHYKKVNNCDRAITEDHVGFMLQGGILDKYDNGRVFISIVHVVDPKDWQYNEYFTGKGFSKNEEEELKVIDHDSCELKQKYFNYLETVQHSR